MKMVRVPILVTAILLSAVSRSFCEPLRTECKKIGNFEKHEEGYALEGFFISEQEVPSWDDCAFECLQVDNCRSINVKKVVNHYLCQLNSGTRAKNPSHYKPDPNGYTYYDSDRKTPGCASSPCKNGGVCCDSCEDNKYECACPEGSTGRHCETWTPEYLDFRVEITDADVGNYAEAELTESYKDLTVCLAFRTSVFGKSLVTMEDNTKKEMFYMGTKSQDEIEIKIAGESIILYYPMSKGTLWTSLCFRWWGSSGSWSALVDGPPIRHSGRQFAVNAEIRTGKIILGQKRLNGNSGFDAALSAVGQFKQLKIWNLAINNATMKKQTGCEDAGYIAKLRWSAFFGGVRGNASRVSPSECVKVLNPSHYFLFDGSNKDTYLLPPSNLPELTAFTICVWHAIKSGSKFNPKNAIFSYATLGAKNHIQLLYQVDATLVLYLDVEHSAWRSPLSYGSRLHHLCVTWESSTGSVKYYIDGTAQYQKTGLRTGYVVSANQTAMIGQIADHHDGSYTFQGALTRFNMWSRVLPEETIDALSRGAGAEAGDVIKWHDITSKQIRGSHVNSLSPTDASRDFPVSGNKYRYGAKFDNATTGSVAMTTPTDMTFPIYAFTMSVWFWTQDDDDFPKTLFSYATSTVQDALTVEFPSATRIEVFANGAKLVAIDTPSIANSWNQVAIRRTTTMFKVYSTAFEMKHLTSSPPLLGPGRVVLGQRQQITTATGFVREQAFTGVITKFEMWNKLLGYSFVQHPLARWCAPMGVGNIFTMGSDDDIKTALIGDVKPEVVPSQCYAPRVSTNQRMDQYCSSANVAHTSCKGVATWRKALFDERQGNRGKKWGCYATASVATSTFSYGFRYVSGTNYCSLTEAEITALLND